MGCSHSKKEIPITSIVRSAHTTMTTAEIANTQQNQAQKGSPENNFPNNVNLLPYQSVHKKTNSGVKSPMVMMSVTPVMTKNPVVPVIATSISRIPKASEVRKEVVTEKLVVESPVDVPNPEEEVLPSIPDVVDIFAVYNGTQGIQYKNEPAVTLSIFLRQYHNVSWLRNHRTIFQFLLPSEFNKTKSEDVEKFRSEEKYMNSYRKVLRIIFSYYGTEPKVVNTNIVFEHTAKFIDRFRIWGREPCEYKNLTLLFNSLVAVSYQFYATALYQLFLKDADNGYLVQIKTYLPIWSEFGVCSPKKSPVVKSHTPTPKLRPILNETVSSAGRNSIQRRGIDEVESIEAKGYKIQACIVEKRASTLYTVDKGEGIKVLKRIQYSNLPAEAKKMVFQELEILKKLHHRNVIEYSDVFAIPGFICMVTTYCANGDLLHLIQTSRSQKDEFNDKEILRLFVSLLRGIDYIHSLGIIHRNLKPENIFLNHVNDCIIGDFGIAKSMDTNLSHTTIGSPSYMPPEMYENGRYDQRVDIWAAGCILYELIEFQPPFSGTLYQLQNVVPTKPYPPLTRDVVPGISELINLALTKDYRKRPSAKELIKIGSDALTSLFKEPEKYHILKEIGSGSWGKVFLVSSQDQYYVMKEMSTKGIDKKSRDMMESEISILKRLNSPYVVHYIDGFSKDRNIYLVMQYCSKGDMEQKISIQRDKFRSYFKEQMILYYIQCIALGLYYIHSQKIIHRDMKPANIFLDDNDACLIGDFGVSTATDTNQKAKTVIGSPLYMAPEMFLNLPYDNKVDIWGLGCITHELCCLESAFTGNNMITLVTAIRSSKTPRIPKYYSSDLQQLIDTMLTKEPNKRPSAKQILDNKCFANSH